MRGVFRGMLFAFVLAFVFSGCATMAKKTDATEIQSLKAQVSDLESKVQRKDAEIESLRSALSRTTEEKYNATKGDNAAATTRVPTGLQIQKALKAAGFYKGDVDGKIGTQTKKAIRDFQKANNLTADGKVGPKTWSLLGPYAEK